MMRMKKFEPGRCWKVLLFAQCDSQIFQPLSVGNLCLPNLKQRQGRVGRYIRKILSKLEAGVLIKQCLQRKREDNTIHYKVEGTMA